MFATRVTWIKFNVKISLKEHVPNNCHLNFFLSIITLTLESQEYRQLISFHIKWRAISVCVVSLAMKIFFKAFSGNSFELLLKGLLLKAIQSMERGDG